MKGSILNSSVISGAIMLGVMGILILGLRLIKSRLKKDSCRISPKEDSLCDPGESHLEQIDDLDADIRMCILALIIIPILVFVVHITYSYLGGQPESLGRIAISSAGVLAFMTYFLWKLMSVLRERRLVRLAYEGKVAAGRALNQLAADGYRIFHDFPAEDFSIDHLAVGPTGIMTVKTGTWYGVRIHGRDGDAIVKYDGRMLHFPKFSDFETIDQAKAQAEWLSQWLSSEAGEDVCARAMVVVPGWSVRRTSADGIPVVNPDQFENLFKYLKPRSMSERLMQRILQLIEERFRDRALS